MFAPSRRAFFCLCPRVFGPGGDSLRIPFFSNFGGLLPGVPETTNEATEMAQLVAVLELHLDEESQPGQSPTVDIETAGSRTLINQLGQLLTLSLGQFGLLSGVTL